MNVRRIVVICQMLEGQQNLVCLDRRRGILAAELRLTGRTVFFCFPEDVLGEQYVTCSWTPVTMSRRIPICFVAPVTMSRPQKLSLWAPVTMSRKSFWTWVRTGAKNNPGTAVQNLKHPVTCQSNWQKPGKYGAVGTFFRSAQTCPSTPSVEDDFHFSGDRQRGILFSARPCDASAKMVKQEIVRRRNCFTQLIRVPKDVRKKWMTVLGDKWWNYFCKIGSLVLKMEDKSWNI